MAVEVLFESERPENRRAFARQVQDLGARSWKALANFAISVSIEEIALRKAGG